VAHQNSAQANRLQSQAITEIRLLNAIPGEIVDAEIWGRRQGVSFGQAVQIKQPSTYRVEPLETHYTCCSPWQIISYPGQQKFKLDWIKSEFQNQAGLTLSDLTLVSDGVLTGYRNKVEFSFFTETTSGQISLAFHNRGGGKGKQKLTECVLMNQLLNQQAKRILEWIVESKLDGFSLKSLILRSSNVQRKVVAILYVKDEAIDQKIGVKRLTSLLDDTLQGFRLVYSTPKSPASVTTRLIHEVGEMHLQEDINGIKLKYTADGFFQVNIPVFAKTMKTIKDFVQNLPNSSELSVLDLYAGVGTLGLGVAKIVKKVRGVELYPGSKALALQNAKLNHIQNFEFEEGAAEAELDLSGYEIVMVDPPRSGLNPRVTHRILQTVPKYMVYLSCHPASQARDFNLLQTKYKVIQAIAFDYYPHTPHVENLLILEKI
jgi:23S rRNA (uracil1939-C5)-methyltransferase